VQVLSGDAATTTNIANPPTPDWDTAANPGKQPLNGIVHQNRLIGFGNLSNAHRIYLSDPTDHENFTSVDARQISLGSHIGERLYGCAEFQGVAFFWKYPQGIFYLDDQSADFLSWGYRIRSQALGCAPSPNAVLATDDDVIFVAPDGHFHLLSAVASLGGQRTSDLTRMFGLHGWTKQNVDTTKLDQTASAWSPATKTACFGLKGTAGGTDNDLLVRWDFGLQDRDGPPRFSYARCWNPNALCIKRRDYIGTPSLLIGGLQTSYFVDPTRYGFSTRKGATIGIGQTVTTPALDFANAAGELRSRRKNYRALEVVLGGPDLASQVLTVAVAVDGTTRQTLTITGSDRRFKLPLKVGDGYEIALTFSLPSTSTTDVRLLGAVIWEDPGGEDQSRAR